MRSVFSFVFCAFVDRRAQFFVKKLFTYEWLSKSSRSFVFMYLASRNQPSPFPRNPHYTICMIYIYISSHNGVLEHARGRLAIMFASSLFYPFWSFVRSVYGEFNVLQSLRPLPTKRITSDRSSRSYSVNSFLPSFFISIAKRLRIAGT